MTAEHVKETLQSRIIPDLREKFHTELKAVYKQEKIILTDTIISGTKDETPVIALSKKAAELGLLLLNQMPDYIEETTYGLFGYTTINQYGKRYYRIEELLGKDAWNNPENYYLLIYFFGAVKAAYARHAWNRIPFQPYQKSYSRRSFRSPNNHQLYLQNQLSFLISVLLQVHVTDYSAYPKTKETYYDLSVAEQMKYAHVLGNQGISSIQAMELFHLWAAALDRGDSVAMQQAGDILFNNDPVGKVTRELVKALMTCDQQEAWAMVEQLLLATQRQEGLRQTILEALDETSTGALKYIIKIILANKLERFSSVIRALDTWVGLGWEGTKENTARRFLEKALLYLEQPDAIPQGISSMDNMDVYMALWALGVTDVEMTTPFLEQLLQHQQAEKRGLAILFAGQTGHYKIMMPIFQPALDDPDLRVSGLAAQLILYTLRMGNENYYTENYPHLYTKLKHLYDRAGIKEQVFEGFIFSWMRSAFNKKDTLRSMILLVATDEVKLNELLGYVEEMDADIRRSISRAILPKQTDYSFKVAEENVLPLTAFQRQYAMLMLKDRTEYDVAYKALYHEPFSDTETLVFADLLKRKSAGFREKILSLLLRQQDEALLPVLEQVLLQGDGEQRLAGLDMLIQLQQQKRLQQVTAPLIESFSQRKNISQKEQILLAQLTGTVAQEEASEANGFGLYDPADIAPVQLPTINPESAYEQRLTKQAYAFSMPVDDIKKAIADLYKIFDDNRNYEFEVENWDGSRTQTLLGNHMQPVTNKPANKTPRGIYETWPLHEVWEAWGQKWKLDANDLLLLSMLDSTDLVSFSETIALQFPWVGSLLTPGQAERVYHYNSPFKLITALAQLYYTEQQDAFCLDACTRLFASFDKKILYYKEKDEYEQPDTGWQSNRGLSIFLSNIHLHSLNDSQVPKFWALYHWRQFSGLAELASQYPPPLLLFCRAYQLQIIGANDLYRGITTIESLHTLSAKKSGPNNYDFLAVFPFLEPMFNRVQNRILDVELKRGDTATSATALANSLQVIYGVHRLGQLLAGLGKTNLSKAYTGYYYGSNNQSKQDSFSNLIKKCYPLKTDTQHDFKDEMTRIKADEKRLLEIAMYAPQWQNMVSNYLGWKGLDTAIWWMHAHTKTNTWQAVSAEAESEIAKYSNVEIKDFGEGAVDKEWFIKAYKLIGKDRWPLVYDTAKYISDGNGHRRARIYADVLLGNTGLNEVTEKIKTKRDQDYVRIYGLVPFTKKNIDQDVLSRYEYLEQFRKESKQFGSLKQSSEAGAIRVALENLARNAGYPDPIRLTWAMESRQVQNILSKETQVQYDDVLIGLVIGEDGVADVVAFKADKQLKEIPAKYRKDKKVLELAVYKKTLREQHRRSRKALEDAMVRGDQFSLAEVTKLHEHPVIFRHLEKLLFVVHTTDNAPGACGFFKDGTIYMPGQAATVLSNKDMLRIAHPTDFYRSGNWAAYQHHLFSFKIQQPFKQVFRELYLPTADELAEQSISRRYAGHQVQPQKTLALLKTRGWKVDYETGLQKVFHQQGFVAKIYAMANWFSPADIESPTLETVEFIDLKTYKNVAFSTIELRIFSEVMRDIDLVVSVAHVGGVDPEASHSSIEMRAALLRETLRLFKIINVAITGSHATIKGTMGEYSVHLGSAVAHQVTKGYLSILPVHSQHRGRLFLPFVDDDPRSAEVVSKVLLLAKDNEIKDPTILQQLR